MSRSKAYCFTINNYGEEDAADLAALERHKHFKYVIFGKEVGKNGTPHLQGYLYMNVEKSRKNLSKILKRAALFPAKGSVEDNFKYCSKENDFYEAGVKPVSQKRKGEMGKEFWDDVKKKAKAGLLDEIDSNVFVSHFSNLTKIAAKYAPMPDNIPYIPNHKNNEWYYGETGSGKSLKARSENPGHYLKMCNKWWDGYNGEEVVIIEDFDKRHGEHLAHHLKIWLDSYAFPAEVKGSKVNLRPKKIIITSNYHPSDIWTDDTTLEPIYRRVNIVHFNKQLPSN